MISAGFTSEAREVCFEIWDVSCQLPRGVHHSCLYCHCEAAFVLCASVFNSHPVVALVVRYLCQFSTVTLNDATLKAEAIGSIFRIGVDIVVIGHSRTFPELSSLSPSIIPAIVFPSTISCRSIISIAFGSGTISTVRDCSPSSSFWPWGE
jgi:hypothetical protein